VAVNFQMVDFFKLWYSSAARFLDGSCMHLRVMAEDEIALTNLTQLREQHKWDLEIRMDHVDLTKMVLNDDETKWGFMQMETQRFPFNSPEYKQITGRKPFYISDLMEQGCTTLFVDVDSIWKKNPFLEIVAEDKGQRDWYGIADEELNQHHAAPTTSAEVGSFCGCFMYVNPTAASFNIIRQWKDGVFKRKDDPNAQDQDVLNDLVRQNGLEQSITLLPYEKFPPGCSYSRYNETASVAHANWLVGHHDKVQFLKKVADQIQLPYLRGGLATGGPSAGGL